MDEIKILMKQSQGYGFSHTRLNSTNIFPRVHIANTSTTRTRFVQKSSPQMTFVKVFKAQWRSVFSKPSQFYLYYFSFLTLANSRTCRQEPTKKVLHLLQTFLILLCIRIWRGFCPLGYCHFRSRQIFLSLAKQLFSRKNGSLPPKK